LPAALDREGAGIADAGTESDPAKPVADCVSISPEAAGVRITPLLMLPAVPRPLGHGAHPRGVYPDRTSSAQLGNTADVLHAMCVGSSLQIIGAARSRRVARYCHSPQAARQFGNRTPETRPGCALSIDNQGSAIVQFDSGGSHVANSNRYSTGGFAMHSRFLVGAVAAAGLFISTCAHADPGYFPMSNFFAAFTAVPRTVVAFQGNQEPGTIIVRTSERRLYLVLGKGRALRYGIGVGRDGYTWSGVSTVTDKREWPDWTPPPEMIRRRPDLPHHMRGGPANPLGARAMYLGDTMYRIHGSNEPHTIGTAATSGCIRLTNEDVIDLYSRVKIGATVIVQR
jgi:lipoprotein-anchoring transpeptidase ErfK/SrfK